MLGRMFKKIFSIFVILLISSVFAGEYEDVISNNDKVFLYLYSPDCSYCVKFKPFFEKLSTLYGEKCKFLGIDTKTKYGEQLAKRFGARFIPYVIIVETKKDRGVVINPSCLVEYSCVNKVVDEVLRWLEVKWKVLY